MIDIMIAVGRQVILANSEQIDAEEYSRMPNLRRIAWLDMRVGQINDVRHSFDATNDATAAPVLREYSAIVRARDGKGEPAAAASSARQILLEQFRVRAGAHEVHQIALNRVDEQKIAANMTFAMVAPFARARGPTRQECGS